MIARKLNQGSTRSGVRWGVATLVALGIAAISLGASAQGKPAPRPEEPAALPPAATSAAEPAPPSNASDKGAGKGPVAGPDGASKGPVAGPDGAAKVPVEGADGGAKVPALGSVKTMKGASPADAAPSAQGKGVSPQQGLVGFGGAVAEGEDRPVEKPRRVWTPVEQHWSLGVGFLGNNVSGEGFDPYSKNDTLPMASVTGTWTPWFSRPFSIHLAGEWNYGGSDATARGAESSLTVNRLALGLEGRVQPLSRMRLFVRVMPGAIHEVASMKDLYLNNRLEGAAWTWGLDMTGGAAARIGAVGHPDGPAASFWISLDLGYRLTGNATMKLRPADLTEEDQTRTFGDVTLPALDLSGFIGKIAFSASF